MSVGHPVRTRGALCWLLVLVAASSQLTRLDLVSGFEQQNFTNR